MGLQPISERRTRRIAAQMGLPIERLVRAENTLWLGRITQGNGHAHIRLDPRTLEWDADLGGCWSSCETPRRLLRTEQNAYSPAQRRADAEAIAATLLAVADAWTRNEPLDYEAFRKADDAVVALRRLSAAAHVPEPSTIWMPTQEAHVATYDRAGHREMTAGRDG